MKLHKIISLVILSVALLFSSCSHAPKESFYIPQSAAFTISFAMENFMQKDSLQGLSSAQTILNELSEYGFSNETFDFAIATMYDKNQTVLQLNQPMYAYLLPSKEFRNAYKCLLVSIVDSAQFGTYLRSHLNENYQQMNDVENCVSYINKHDRFSWIAYNDEVAVFGCSAIHTHGITDCVNAIFAQKKVRSLASNSDFCSFAKKQSDMNVWMSSTQVIETYLLWNKELPKVKFLNGIPEKALYGNYIHASVNFDKNCRIKVDCNPSKSFRTYWKRHHFTKIPNAENMQFVCANVPNPLWFASFAINPKDFWTLVKDADVALYIDKELHKLNLTGYDFAQSFTGDIAVSVYDVSLEIVRSMLFAPSVVSQQMVWKHFQKDMQTTFPHVAIAAKMNQNEFVNLVFSHVSSEICEQIAPHFYDFSKIMGFPLYMICKDSLFLLVTDKTLAEQKYNEKEYNSIVAPEMKSLYEQAKNNTSYHYFNFTVEQYPQTMKNFLQEMNVLALSQKYSNIVKTGQMKLSDEYEGSIIFEFNDTTQNSLSHCNELLQIVLPQVKNIQ